MNSWIWSYEYSFGMFSIIPYGVMQYYSVIHAIFGQVDTQWSLKHKANQHIYIPHIKNIIQQNNYHGNAKTMNFKLTWNKKREFEYTRLASQSETPTLKNDKIVVLLISGGSNDDKVGIMATLKVQCTFLFFQQHCDNHVAHHWWLDQGFLQN